MPRGISEGMPSAPATGLTSVASILPAVVGDLVNLPGFDRAYVASQWCASTRPTSYACLTCRQLLANGYQLSVHTETGTHVIARQCRDHGWEAL
jgi:hypothetical protein